MIRFSITMGNAVMFKIERENLDERNALEMRLYTGDGSVASVSANEMNIQYRLLAEFFSRIADKSGEPSLNAYLTCKDEKIRTLAAEICKL